MAGGDRYSERVKRSLPETLFATGFEVRQELLTTSKADNGEPAKDNKELEE